MPASRWIRLLLALLAITILGGLAITLVELTDTALSVQERLEKLPAYLSYPLGFALAAILCGLIWIVWKLLKPIKTNKLPDQQISRTAIEQRIELLANQSAQSTNATHASVQVLLDHAQDELQELDRRASSGSLYLALFGEVSAGKSSLIAALTGANPEINVIGGTTTQAQLYTLELDTQLSLQISDVPGTNEANAASRGVLAREEALRAHVVALVVTGDLSRTEAMEWRWLQAFDKPVWLILNKIDRFNDDELHLLRARLKEKFGAEPICVHASFNEQISVIDARGEHELRTRVRPAQIAPLRNALYQLARQSPTQFEPARAKAVISSLDLKIATAEHAARLEQGRAIVSQYTKRAMVGAMASVAPGSDLLIQGTLAFGLVKSLTDLYGISMRKVDVDDLLSLLSGKLKNSFAILLAIAGNAAKAFPGLGTLGGGALHAVAYALLFETLGKALLDCLDKQLLDAKGGIDRLTLLEKLETELTDHRQMIQRAGVVVRQLLHKSV
jgi:uncharacterized protein